MPSAPPISICLTTYNRAKVLPKTLDSILSQTFADFELIISDDCSTDNTEEICRSYESQDSRIKYFRNQINLKMPGNLNAAISRAQGEYIANLHDGDFYHKDLISKWKAALDDVPSAAFVFNAYNCFHYKTGEKFISGVPFGLKVDGKEIALYFFKTFTSCVWGTVMARRQAYETHGLFNPYYGFISDVDMWLRLARYHDVAYVSEPLITLTPRESDHPFKFVHWHIIFLTLGIYKHHLDFYAKRSPKEFWPFVINYPKRKRKLFLKSMAICLKNLHWHRALEGLALWRDADDRLLKMLGLIFGKYNFLPQWYDPVMWKITAVGKDFAKG